MKKLTKQTISRTCLAGFLYFLSRIIVFWAGQNPEKIELLYSQGVYVYIARFFNMIHGLVPFSIAEIPLIILVFNCILKFDISFFSRDNLIRFLKLSNLSSLISKLLLIMAAISLSFQLLWGLNYYRLPINHHLELDVKEREAQALNDLLTELIAETNDLRQRLSTAPNLSVAWKNNLHYYFKEIPSLFNNSALPTSLPFMELSAAAKPVGFSGLMSFTKTSGIYSPFTGEANININVPDHQILATVAHEIAHRQGFAREDEANFIAWLVLHETEGRPDLQYSGNMLALAYGLNAYYKVAPQNYSALYQSLSPLVTADFSFARTFWQRYEGPVEKISDTVNNQYLQSNQQKDGVQSYGRMIDLLLAYYEKYKLMP